MSSPPTARNPARKQSPGDLAMLRHRRRKRLHRLAIWAGLVGLTMLGYVGAYQWGFNTLISRTENETAQSILYTCFSPAIEIDYRHEKRQIHDYFEGLWIESNPEPGHQPFFVLVEWLDPPSAVDSPELPQIRLTFSAPPFPGSPMDFLSHADAAFRYASSHQGTNPLERYWTNAAMTHFRLTDSLRFQLGLEVPVAHEENPGLFKTETPPAVLVASPAGVSHSTISAPSEVSRSTGHDRMAIFFGTSHVLDPFATPSELFKILRRIPDTDPDKAEILEQIRKTQEYNP